MQIDQGRFKRYFILGDFFEFSGSDSKFETLNLRTEILVPLDLRMLRHGIEKSS